MGINIFTFWKNYLAIKFVKGKLIILYLMVLNAVI